MGCRHHLLLELTEAGALTLNRPQGARHGALGETTPEALVNAWIDDAIEQLGRMEYTCALDVVDDHPDGIGPSKLARLLGMAKQSADYLTTEAKRSAASAGSDLGDAPIDR